MGLVRLVAPKTILFSGFFSQVHQALLLGLLPCPAVDSLRGFLFVIASLVNQWPGGYRHETGGVAISMQLEIASIIT